jgi:hypothetical protein
MLLATVLYVLAGNFFYFRSVWILKKNNKKASWWSIMYNQTAFKTELKDPQNSSKEWFTAFKQSVLMYRVLLGIWAFIVVLFIVSVFYGTGFLEEVKGALL